ncbi:MAG: DNA-processing protein DprA [Lachnospiraceae bacterium]|nr:DNA-processing protein DprA [Lachnospiraceae bacterium]
MEITLEKAKEEQRERHILWNAFASFCITPRMQEAVLAYFESPQNALLAGEREWSTFFRLAEQLRFSESQKQRIREVLRGEHEKEYECLEKKGISFITQEDKEYPEKFRTLFSAPRFLYYKGVLPGEIPLIAIIGARNCSHYGSETAWRIAKKLAEQGVGIVSGLAYGVDKAAHDGALSGGGPTYAVLGCGVDICYPKANERTYDRILSEGGSIISEYPPGTQPLPCFFPQRNRIIAGFSDGILVTEARKKSGSLITVSFGLEYGKNIYAVPGRIDDVVSEGCNYLLKEGAKPVTGAEDILEDFMSTKPGKRKKQEDGNMRNLSAGPLSEREKAVYRCLSIHFMHIDEICSKTGLDPRELAQILEALARKGYIARHGQAYYSVFSGSKQE